MPTTSADQGLVYPANSDLNDIPTGFATLLTGVESRLVKRYASAADRTSRNPTPNTNELSVRADAVGTFEYYDGAAWSPIWKFGTTVTTRGADSGSGTTTSAAYTDTLSGTSTLATTLTTPATGGILILFGGWIFNSGGANQTYMSFRTSGGTTVASNDVWAVITAGTTGNRGFSAKHFTVGGGGDLAANSSHTFTLQHKVTAGTGTFQYRGIIAVPVP